MKRREVVAAALGLGSATGCLGTVPDATGPRTPPTPPEGDGTEAPQSDLYVGTFDAEAAADGDLRVVGTVVNRVGVRRTGTVEATARVGGETHAASTRVAVDAAGEARFAVTFDVAYDAFAREGSVDVGVRS